MSDLTLDTNIQNMRQDRYMFLSISEKLHIKIRIYSFLQFLIFCDLKHNTHELSIR